MTWRRLRWRIRRLVRRHPLVTLAVVVGLAVVVVHGAGDAAAAPGGSNVQIGQQLAGGYGWGTGAQWLCLVALWDRESGWSATATNPQSGAYGIPQALPPSKMPAAALPPESSAPSQITWGLSYIAGTYGTPCGAWQHETDDGWY